MAKRMNPLLPLAGLGALLFAVSSSKKASALTPGTPSGGGLPAGGGSTPAPPVPTVPATPAPAGVQSVPITINGHAWKLVPITGQTVATVDVYAQAGAFGPHGELRVCRFTQATTDSPRVLAGVAEGVPKAVLDAAMKDLQIQVPASGPAATSTTPPGRPSMPASLQQELVATMAALGVGADGVVRGPTTADAVRRATELSSRLEQAGYPEAAAQLRRYAQDASKLLPAPAAPAPAIPGVPPDLMAQIQRALELERDPAKLEALKAALKVLPPSAERDLLIGALDALILQIRSAQAVSTAATEIDQMTTAATEAATTAVTTATGSRVLKLVTPNMTGQDVSAWQLVLIAAGYPITADGVFGPKTDAATKDWQKKRGLTPDGDVGPLTRAAIGRPPTAPLSVPATPSPRPDPAPKTPLEVAAEALVTHLLALQKKYGVAGAKGKEDKALVKRFQSAAGGVADGLTGPGTLLALAKAGQGKLPAVMYWPKAATKAVDLPKFRKALTDLAAAARSRGLSTLAAQLEASAAAETGAGGLK